jgi:hypothetical protein
MKALTLLSVVLLPLVAGATPPKVDGRNAKYVAKYLGLPGTAKITRVERADHRGWYRYHFTIESAHGTVDGYRDASVHGRTGAFAPTTITSPKGMKVVDAWRLLKDAK